MLYSAEAIWSSAMAFESEHVVCFSSTFRSGIVVISHYLVANLSSESESCIRYNLYVMWSHLQSWRHAAIPATILQHITSYHIILLSWPCWANANCHISPPHACSAALWTWWHHTIGDSKPQPADFTWDVDWVRAASATSKPFWSSWIRPPKTRMKGSMLERHRFLKVCCSSHPGLQLRYFSGNWNAVDDWGQNC